MHIRKLVSGRYQCMIRLQGVSTSKTFRDKQSAKIWGQEQELAIVGGHPHDSSSKYVLSDLIARYMSECVPHLKDKYNVNNQCIRILRDYRWLVQKRLNNLSVFDFEKFKYERKNNSSFNKTFKNGYRSTNKDLILFSSIFNKAINVWGIKTQNYTLKIPKFPVSKGIYRPIKMHEHKLLLSNANKKQKLIILLARHTGLRPNEIFNLKANDVDYERKKIIVRAEISKNYISREVDIPLSILKKIKSLYQSNESKLINYSRTAFRFWFYRIVKKNNFENFIFYNYRRHYVQRLIDKGHSIPKVASLTGHSSWGMVARYYGHLSLRN